MISIEQIMGWGFAFTVVMGVTAFITGQVVASCCRGAYEREAVAHGAATFEADEDGDLEFRWKA